MQRRTPKACRLWFDIKLARAGYINRFSLAKFTTYGSVLKVDPTTNYETIPMSNNLFCGPFGHNNELTIVILPYYAESPLEKMDYLDFLDALLKLNPGLNLNRLEVFKIWFTVITTEYPFEDDKKIQRVIDQVSALQVYALMAYH